jgi:adenine-specific DNA-methyltransferase
MTKDFNEKLIELLKTDSRFVDDEGELVKAAVIDRAWKIDRNLVKLLLSKPEIKAKFFDEIEGHWIFNINTFIEYVADKNFLANSYTRFRNKIGLNIDGKFLRERGEVSLVWPYKDCVLEGGQTKDEEKRKEIFFNEILAQDEIDRLFDPKVLTNWKRYTVNGEQKVKEIERNENGTIRENLIIKGNNLLALHTLKKQFRGKVKLVYIDPPFNTGNDSFKYNDNFNQSTWLTFMKNRLEAAKDLISEEGAIFIQLDDNEVAYTKLLCDEIFGRENYRNQIVLETNSPFGYKSTAEHLFKQAGHILLYCKNKSKFILNKLFIEKQYDPAYRFIFDDLEKPEDKWQWKDIGDAFAKEYGYVSKKEAIDKLGESEYKAKIAIYAIENADRVFRTASVTGGAYKKRKDTIEKSKKDRNKIIRHPNDDMDYMFIAGERVLFYRERLREIDGIMLPGTIITDLWTDIAIEGIAKEGGVTFERGKKPEQLLKRIIELVTEPDELILDYVCGSGTTCAVAHKLGRQYIGVEQLDYIETLPLNRLINVTKGDQSGISKTVNWKGGGDFIYCELMKYNEAFMHKVQTAKTSEELVELWKDIAENSFLNWYVNPEIPEEAVDDFIEIGQSEKGMEKQKKLLAELLNKNQLYVNLSEIGDSDFNVSDEDKKLNQLFYGENS